MIPLLMTMTMTTTTTLAMMVTVMTDGFSDLIRDVGV